MKASTKKYVENEAKKLDLDGLKKAHDDCIEKARGYVYYNKQDAIIEIQAAIIYDKEYGIKKKMKGCK